MNNQNLIIYDFQILFNILEEIEENLLHGKKLKDLGTLKDLPPSMQH